MICRLAAVHSEGDIRRNMYAKIGAGERQRAGVQLLLLRPIAARDELQEPLPIDHLDPLLFPICSCWGGE